MSQNQKQLIRSPKRREPLGRAPSVLVRLLDEEQREELKVMANRYGMTLNAYCLAKLFNRDIEPLD